MPDKQKTYFGSLDPDKQVGVALAYSFKRTELKGEHYAGTRQSELEEILKNMGSTVSKDQLKTTIEANARRGVISQEGVDVRSRKKRTFLCAFA